MVATIEHTHFHARQRITGQYTRSHGSFKSFLDSRDKLLRYTTTENIVHELEMFSFVFFQPLFVSRSDRKLNIRELTTTTRLFLQYFAMFHRRIEGFFISHLG